jgi:hypothetical protein
MMLVYMKTKTPIVIETNLEYALPYWQKRKLSNPEIRWTIIKEVV